MAVHRSRFCAFIGVFCCALGCLAQSSNDSPCFIETSGIDSYIFPHAFVPTFHDTVYFKVQATSFTLRTSTRPYASDSEKYIELKINQETGTITEVIPPGGPGVSPTRITIIADTRLSLSTNQDKGYYIRISQDGIVSIGIQSDEPFQLTLPDSFKYEDIYQNNKFIGIKTQGMGTWDLCNDDVDSLQLSSYKKDVTLSDGANTNVSYAVDGDITLCSVIAGAQTDFWIRIDLGDVYKIALVEVNTGSNGNIKTFLNDAKIRIGSCHGEFEVQNREECGSSIYPVTSTEAWATFWTCPTSALNNLGQFVRIVVPDTTGRVEFCEVRVFGRKVKQEEITVVQFKTTDIQHTEEESVELEIVRIGNTQSCASVDIVVYDHQETLLSTTPVNIASGGSSSRRVPVSLESENSGQEPESFTIRLNNSIGARIGDRNTIDVMINDTEGPTEKPPSAIGAIVGGVVGGIIIVVLIVLAVLLYRSKRIHISSSFRSFTLRRKLTRSRPMNPTTTEQPDDGFQNPDYHFTHEVQQESRYLTPDILSVNTNCEIDRSCVELHEILGTGANGEVYRATASGVVFGDVAVKKLKAKGDKRHESDFKKELDFLKSLEPHPNIIGFIGCCTDKEPYYLILEYAAEGNLQTYLRKTREKQRSHILKPTDIIRFALDITKGMEYIASKNCIHRDLATRNVLLSEGKVCKLSDFGLARAMEIDGEYEMKSGSRVPVRWMAPESILDNKYSIKTDVWSFGVVLWELVTMGAYPYGGMNAAAVLNMVNSGKRLAKPEHCHDDTYNFMSKCWDTNPKKRPDFRDIHAQLDLMMADALEYVNMPNIKRPSYLYLTPHEEKKRDEESTREMIEYHFEQQGKAPRIPPKPLPRRHVPRQIQS